MHTSVSPGGLLRIQADGQSWRAERLPTPWSHPQLRPLLLKSALLVGVAMLLVGLEWQGRLQGGAPGLFPGLLGVGVLLQGWGIQTLRHRCLRLEASRTHLRIWESAHPETEPHALRWGEIGPLHVATQTTGRYRQQPVLQLSDSPVLQVGGGLPAAELTWLLEDLNQWRKNAA
ncbi:MAG: hypothetical protein ACO1RX_10920 [Candidatus Sericytochromatia bacterium]